MKGAKDFGRGMKKNAQKCMPEFAKGGKVAKFAVGGVAKVRHNQASPKGAPKPPRAKFGAKLGRG